MNKAIAHLLICSALFLAPAPAFSFLADDFNSAEYPGRLIVGGELVPTPSGRGKAWDGGRGWRSDMRIDPLEAGFYGRRDYVLYRNLRAGIDLPLEQGTLEIWFRRDRPRTALPLSDNLLALVGADGEVLATIAISYPEDDLPSQLDLMNLGGVWGEGIPLPPIGLGEWAHLAFTWGAGERENRLFFNGREVPLPPRQPREGFAAIVRATVALKLGIGWDDADPAYRTVIDAFLFSGEIRSEFDLSQPPR